MSLHLRKMMAQQIEDSKSPEHHFSSTDQYEEWLLDAMMQDDPHITLGALTVIAADLLEQVRRSDPAYGLVPIDTLTLRVDGHTFG